MPTCSHPGPNGYQVITAVNGRYEHISVDDGWINGCFSPGAQLSGITVRSILKKGKHI